MTNHKRKNPLCLLLVLSLFFFCCEGQTKSGQKKEAAGDPQPVTSNRPKLTKTQGTNEYQNIHCSLLDKAGNLWFGTTGEGVYRYDGTGFTQFTVKDGLSDNSVWSMIEDASGIIWFGTDKGLSRYNGKILSSVPIAIGNNGRLFPPFPAKDTDSLKNAVWSLLQDRRGIIWVGTDRGVYRYDGKRFSRFPDSPGITNNEGLTLKSIQCMFEDKEGKLWFGSGPQAAEGICLFDGRSLTRFKPQGEGWIRKITEDKKGTLLFATRHTGLIAYDGKKFSSYSQPPELEGALFTAVLVDSKGNIWYGSDYTNDKDLTAGGVWKFDGTSFVAFTKKDGLSNTTAFSLLEDKAGDIWIGTRNCGLFRYDGQRFTTFSQ